MRLAVLKLTDRRLNEKRVVPLATCAEGVLCAIDDDAEGDQAVEIPDGDSFQVIPETRAAVAQHIHMAGPSGVGKSTWAGAFANEFKTAKEGRVVVVSADGCDDPAIDADIRLKASEELGDVNIEELADGEQPLLIIFDDCEGVKGSLATALGVFRQALLERGRKLGISTINIYHRGAAGKATRDSLNEATGCVVFPRAGLSKNTLYMLAQYFSTPPGFLALVRKSPEWGRAVYISNTFPPVAIGDRRAALICGYEVEAAAKADRAQAREKSAQTLAGQMLGRTKYKRT